MSEASDIAAPEAAPVVPSADQNAVVATDTPAEGASDSSPDEAGDEPKPEKPRQRASERIGELYARMKAAERERDQAVQEAQRLRQPVVDASQWDQLTFDQQQAAQMRHAVRQERADQLATEAEIRARDAYQARATMFQERLEAVRERIPDIDAAINDPDLPISEIGARLIQEHDKGPHVAYWLSKNRAEAARIARLNAHDQAFELGQIVQRINAAPASRKVSQASAPVPKVGGGGGGGAKDPSAMSMSEYVAWRNSSRR